MISATLILFSFSVVSSGIPNDASCVLFLNCVPEINLGMENHYKVISIKNNEMNQTIIIIITINNIYLLKWFTTITNDYTLHIKGVYKISTLDNVIGTL